MNLFGGTLARYGMVLPQQLEFIYPFTEWIEDAKAGMYHTEDIQTILIIVYMEIGWQFRICYYMATL